MTDALVRACGGFLDMLGGCAVPAEGLARLADYFELDSRRVAAAASALEENHDLGYGSVRRLLAACLEELCGALSCCGGRRLVEVSVPAPLPLVMALQRSAASRARFSTAALLAEIFLRGLMLDSRPLDGRSCGVRRCGLNRMRERLLTAPPAGDIALALQFGSLCDECVKTGEGFAGKEKCVSCTLPRSGAQREALSAELLRLTARAACERLGVRLGEADIEHGLALYGRLMRVQARLALLNARAKRRPLCGNSFALAQTVQLCCFDDWEAPLSALETLAGELEGAPAGFVGIMTTVYLVSKVVSSLVLGRIADRFGATRVLRCSCLCGAAAALMVILIRDWRLAFVMYALLAVAVNGVMMSNNIACVAYSGNVRTPIYAAASGLLCAPLYVVSSFAGAAIVGRFSYTAVFLIAMAVYAVCALLTFTLKDEPNRR